MSDQPVSRISYIARGVTPEPPDAMWRQAIICPSCRSVLMYWGVSRWIDGHGETYQPVAAPDGVFAEPGYVSSAPSLRFGVCGECGTTDVKAVQVVARGVPTYFLGFLILPNRMWGWLIKEAVSEHH